MAPIAAQTIGEFVLTTLGAAASGNFAQELERAQTTQSERPRVLRALADALAASSANVLRSAALPLSDLENHQHFEHDSSWKYGTTVRRLLVLDELIKAARDAAPTAPDDATALARGALLLAAQETDFFCLAAIKRVFAQEDVVRLLRLTDEKTASIRERIAAESKHTTAATGEIAVAVRAFDDLNRRPANEWSDELQHTFIGALDQLASLCPGHPQLAWRLANLAWRFRNLARTKGNDAAGAAIENALSRWHGQLTDIPAQRWLHQAATREGEAPRSAGVKVLLGRDLAARIKAPASSSR